jgi:hypothetical protein
MLNNPVFLEGIKGLRGKILGRFILTLYISILFILLLISPDGSGNILETGFQPPAQFNFMIISQQIISFLFFFFCLAILVFRVEETQTWIVHGHLTLVNIFSGRFLLSVLLTCIVSFISFPMLFYSARISAVHDYIVYFSILSNFVTVFTLGQVWIVTGLLISNKKIIRIIIIWVYLFFYLLISAKVLPEFNPVLSLFSLIRIEKTGMDPGLFFQLIKPALLINLVLFLLGIISAIIISVRRKNIDVE